MYIDNLEAEIERRLADLDPEQINDPELASAALSDVMVTVILINRELATGLDQATSSLPDKLKKWLDDVREAVARIAWVLRAASYSISAGLPAGITATVTFSPQA